MRWWQPSPKSAEIKPIPWLAPAVVQHLENIIQPDFEVLEHGSGGSTLWFAERVAEVYAVEGDPDWREIVKKEAPGNVTLWGEVELGNIRTNFPFDLLLIDGTPVEDRASWITAASLLVKPGGWVVLDNANRPEYAREREALQQIAESYETFDGNEGDTLYLVTDFYKLKGASNEDRTQPEPRQEGAKPKRRSSRSRNAST